MRLAVFGDTELINIFPGRVGDSRSRISIDCDNRYAIMGGKAARAAEFARNVFEKVTLYSVIGEGLRDLIWGYKLPAYIDGQATLFAQGWRNEQRGLIHDDLGRIFAEVNERCLTPSRGIDHEKYGQSVAMKLASDIGKKLFDAVCIVNTGAGVCPPENFNIVANACYANQIPLVYEGPLPSTSYRKGPCVYRIGERLARRSIGGEQINVRTAMASYIRGMTGFTTIVTGDMVSPCVAEVGNTGTAATLSSPAFPVPVLPLDLGPVEFMDIEAGTAFAVGMAFCLADKLSVKTGAGWAYRFAGIAAHSNIAPFLHEVECRHAYQRKIIPLSKAAAWVEQRCAQSPVAILAFQESISPSSVSDLLAKAKANGSRVIGIVKSGMNDSGEFATMLATHTDFRAVIEAADPRGAADDLARSGVYVQNVLDIVRRVPK